MTILFLAGALLVAGSDIDATARLAELQAPRARPSAGDGSLAPAEVLNMLDAYAIVQAQQTLRLSDDQYGEFVKRLKQLQQTRRRNLQARHRVLQELRALTAPQVSQVDEPAVRERLQALRELDRRSASELQKAYEALDEVLDLRQQARFRLFEELLERRKIELLKRAELGAARQRR
jgi:hypothetical protein